MQSYATREARPMLKLTPVSKVASTTVITYVNEYSIHNILIRACEYVSYENRNKKSSLKKIFHKDGMYLKPT